MDPEEILFVVKEITLLHEDGEKPDFYSATAILAERYEGQSNAVGKMIAIMTRMHSLAQLMEKKDERMRG